MKYVRLLRKAAFDKILEHDEEHIGMTTDITALEKEGVRLNKEMKTYSHSVGINKFEVWANAKEIEIRKAYYKIFQMKKQMSKWREQGIEARSEINNQNAMILTGLRREATVVRASLVDLYKKLNKHMNTRYRAIVKEKKRELIQNAREEES